MIGTYAKFADISDHLCVVTSTINLKRDSIGRIELTDESAYPTVS
jgi:hypothetical protein